MLVDGDQDSRSVYRIVLTYHGYDVIEVADGESALVALQQDPCDVVVTELTLRLLDGHRLLERLRQDERTRDICVVVVTARGLEEDRERAEEAGCNRFLLKPLEPQALLREIAVLLTERAPPPEEF
jgi:CheY-like chemotaxis protein